MNEKFFYREIRMNFILKRAGLTLLGMVSLLTLPNVANANAEVNESIPHVGHIVPQQESDLITGEIHDAFGEPVIGASVKLKDAPIGTVTDIDGKFSIKAKEGDVLVITYVGFQPKEITVGRSATVSVILEESSIEMGEVVVVGYGTQKKVNLTGAISTIGSETLEKRPVISASSALQGIAPGVTVTTQSGAPGADGGQIKIRGISSFGGSDTSPLILIDGIAGVLDYLDPNLIESITVLKDAASAAIYGSRAANGVILVTTKRAGQQKFSATYRGYVGWQDATDIPKVTDGLTYMRMFNEASLNDGGTELYSEADIAEFREKYAADPKNYDWQGAILNGSGFTHNHFVSLTASTGNLLIMPSFSYTSQDGIIKNTGYERYVFRNNIDVELAKNLHMKLDMSFTNGDRQQIANEGTVWNYLGRMPTNIPIRRNGRWSEGWVNNNPVGFIEEGGNLKTNNIELTGNLSLSFTPVEWLNVTGVIAPRYRTRNTHAFTKSLMTYNDDGSQAGASNTYTSLSENAYRYFFQNYQVYATASKTWNDHSFKLMAGSSRETYDQKYLMGYRRDYSYTDYEVLNAGADNETKDNAGSHDQWCLISAFGRLNYDYKSRYLLEANIRYDGSSRFIKKNRWAVFPSFSGGWRISEEAFMEDARNVVDQLKLRASWGKLGNQNIPGSFYPFAEELAIGGISMNENIYQLVTLNTMANPDLKWEESTMLDIGVDVNLFGKLSLTADWYRKITDGILLKLNTSQLTGLNSPYQNAAEVKNVGWDLSINYYDKWGELDFGLGVNLSDVKNEITDMRGQASGSLLRNQEGSAVNSIYGYIADGLYQSQEEIKAGPSQFGTLQPGDIRYKDIAGTFDEKGNPIPDGKITEEDKAIIGSTIPRYTYGINLNLGWRGFKLNAFFQGVGKVDGYLNSHYVIPCVNSSAIKTWQLDYWREDNRNSEFPRLSTTSTNNTQNSTYWMRSASYLRLKNLQVGYSLPAKLLAKTGLRDIYLYANAQNLLTITDFWKGYDPEIAYDSGATDGVSIGGGAYYPQVKVFSVGIDIKF
jgi:TonB-linked SusC/RagA family outer membrane protein